MTPILRFLQSLRSLQKSGVIKSVDEAYDFAKREFGEINDLLKRQIEQVFKTGKPAPKPGEGGITSIKNAPKKQEPGIVDQIEASGKRLEGAANRMSEIQKEIDAMYKPKPDTSPLMGRLEEGIETLKQMKQPGMDLATGLTRTAARKILDKAGIQVPDKVDAIEVFVKEFGGESLIDVKNVAEEMIELERMGKSLKSMDEILEQSGLFDITRNPNARKGMSDEQLEQIKKEVDQDKMIKDFDPTDREPNSMGGLNRTGFAYGTGKSLFKYLKGKKNLLKKIKESVEDIFTTGDPKYDADVAVDNMLENLGVDRDMFDQKEILDAYGMAYDELKKPLLAELKNKPGSKPIKQGDPITSENFGESQFAPDTSDLEKAKILDDVDESYGVTPEMKKELDELSGVGAPITAKSLELMKKYPGLNLDVARKIASDPDPQRQAEAIAMIDQAFEMTKKGMSLDEIVDVFSKNTDRTKQAEGGLSYLMGM
jgi:hypothetical protein